MVVVGDLVGEIRDLRLQARLPAQQKSLRHGSQLARVVRRAVLQNALARLEAKVQTIERAIALFQFIDDPERLKVVLEATELPHTIVQRILASMTEGRMPQIVCERDRFDQILV